ncbi:hypothetical protein HUB98_22535 [Paenibacillus barcinonensis]|uniref:Uncharacterized protein n=1 Tax=Paenibacillus barcinonensis TaxID=198119 RepID=A0A2V4V9B5_PAEBA|nr:hypothetical protein [Paenibacillus barcinonensis]PYE48582.1 hypothetical protein DFQ00_108174 [Paenibacillus barcinonensis]QKS58725.1 hypothetical protein HUB98_22535 [Paenibacillus barcinonensis]
MKKHLDICYLSGQLNIDPKRLEAWLNHHASNTPDQELEPQQRSGRMTSPYRLTAPASLSLAPSTNQSIRYRGRFSN